MAKYKVGDQVIFTHKSKNVGKIATIIEVYDTKNPREYTIKSDTPILTLHGYSYRIINSTPLEDKTTLYTPLTEALYS